MPKDIHDVIDKNLISSFKRYKTTVQDTILRIAGDDLQETYDLTDTFTDTMLDPDSLRPDIVYAKAAQYDFDIRKEASLSEQIKLLNSINAIYSKRGSIDSIEHMWKYYGGDLPKNVKISIPAHNIFRYGISKFSGVDVFQDGSYNRSGVYSITIEGDYDVPKLLEFLNKEFVAAGTKIAYIKRLFLLSSGDNLGIVISSDNVLSETLLHTFNMVSLTSYGLKWSTNSLYKTWSGIPNLFIDISRVFELDTVEINVIDPLEILITFVKSSIILANRDSVIEDKLLSFNILTICTPETIQMNTDVHFYDVDGNELINRSNYPGYFILGQSLLGEVII